MPVEILKIARDSNFYIEGNLISTKDVDDLNDYMVQLLGLYTTLEQGITLSELTHAFFGMKKFVESYFSDDYERLRAFVTATNLNQPCSCVRFFKSLRSEPDDLNDTDEYIYILPESEFVRTGENERGLIKLGELPVIIDENLRAMDSELLSFTTGKKSKMTLLDVLHCLFEETTELIRSGENVAC